ncbi:unnamed protein product [Heterobilharzia americana]|nr:unnamed protein product [Heterobilharzia americana]
MRIPKTSPVSPMLSFLNKKHKDSLIQSPDIQNVSTISEECVNFRQVSKVCPDYMDEEKNRMDDNCDKSVESFITVDKSVSDMLLCNNLDILYKRLKHEADSLETWKCDTLSKLKEKCMHLQSFQSLVENLRRANVDLQMNLENVSFKYKDELVRRDKLREKISYLKDNNDVLEVKIEKLGEASLTSNLLKHAVIACSKEKVLPDGMVVYLTPTELHRYQDLYNNSVNNSKFNLKALKESNTKLGEKNKDLADELLFCRQRYQDEVIQLQIEIDQLSTEKIELKESEKNHICTNEKYVSRIKDLENALKNEEMGKEKFEERLRTTDKEAQKLKCLCYEFYHKWEIKLKFLNTFHERIINLGNQEIESRKHEQRNIKDEEILTNLSKQKQSILELVRETKERSFIMRDFEMRLYQTCVDLTMENQLLKSDHEGLIMFKENVVELEKEVESSRIRENKLREALEECHIRNEKLQVDNDAVHAKYGESQESHLKAQTFIKLLQDKVKTIRREMNELKKRTADVEIELQEEKLNASKSKEFLQVSETKFHELKMRDEKHQKDLNMMHLEMKEKEEQHEEIKRQLRVLNQENEKNMLKQIQLTHDINDLTMQLEYSRQEIGQQKSREKMIQEQNQRLENAKMELQKQNDSMSSELMSLKERVNQQDNELKQRQGDIDSLREIIDNKNMENSKSNKKVDKKLNDLLNLVEKLREQTKELNRDKKEILKKHTAKEKEVKKLEAKVLSQEKELEEANDENDRLREEIKKMKQKQIEQDIILADNDKELMKLRSTEKEYREFQHQIYSNSPPVSTQLPKEIYEKSINETPVNISKGILRQTGSTVKRRRVFFELTDDKNPATNELDNQSESNVVNEEFESPINTNMSPFLTNTPRFHKVQALEKVAKLRKTPKKTSCKSTKDTITEKIEKSWFDCERLFGSGAED